MNWWNAVLVVSLSLAWGQVRAAETEMGANSSQSSSAEASKAQTAQNILSMMHDTNQQEMKMGQMAQQKSRNPDVQKLAKHIADDHKKSDDKVQALAKKEKVALTAPEAMTPDDKDKMASHKEAMSKLQSAQGGDFDRAFVQAMIDGHRDAILSLTSAQAQVSSDDVRDLIGNTLPTLKEHQSKAEDLLKKLNAPGGAS
jgi:putative membrane protein